MKFQSSSQAAGAEPDSVGAEKNTPRSDDEVDETLETRELSKTKGGIADHGLD